MIKAILSDFSYVLLFPKDKDVSGSINKFHEANKDSTGYEVFNYFSLNQELLEYFTTIKDTYPLYIFTTGAIQNVPEIRSMLDNVFTTIFSARELGVTKDDDRVYEMIAEKIGVLPEEILFIDDTEKNIDAAKNAGLQTIRFVSNTELFTEIKKILQ